MKKTIGIDVERSLSRRKTIGGTNPKVSTEMVTTLSAHISKTMAATPEDLNQSTDTTELTLVGNLTEKH